LATPLGADVPFMTIESPMALAWGRGERLFPVRALDARPALLVVPDFGISTSDAYAWLSSDRGSYAPAADVLAPESLATWEALAIVADNDFERVVARHHPIVAELVDELASAGAAIAMMSGSGSTVFGIFAERPDATAVARSTGFSVTETRTSERVVRVDVDR
jgi:4-diphosphocytidyl-2-C-methyl-D-erythritol kinase